MKMRICVSLRLFYHKFLQSAGGRRHGEQSWESEHDFYFSAGLRSDYVFASVDKSPFFPTFYDDHLLNLHTVISLQSSRVPAAS